MGAQTSLVGQQLNHYKILAPLGKGGMGEVYQARDTKLDRTVALKILPADVATDAERLHRFTREAKAASALNHPHVATIYEIGEASGLRFIAMEYVEGQTLTAKINGQPLAIHEIIEISSQMAEARKAGAEEIAAMKAAFAAGGLKGYWRIGLDRMLEREKSGYFPSMGIAMNHALWGEKGQALARLERTVEERDPNAVALVVEPLWDSYRNAPRFVALVRRVGLVQ